MSSGPKLSDAFVTASECSLDEVQRASLESELASFVDDAAASYPQFSLDASAFVQHVGALCRADTPPHGELAKLSWPELYLAFACGLGVPQAVAEFQKAYDHDIDRGLRRASSVGLSEAELRQRAHVKMLVAGPGSAPQVMRYRGRGSLQGWVRVVVSRMAIDLLRSHGSEREVAVAPAILAEVGRAEADPRFEFLRERHRDVVQTALNDAFSALSDKERRILRGQLVQRLGTDDLGAMFGVHRSTASRWATAARAALMRHTHENLRSALGTGDQTARSLVEMVRSQLELSVERLLASRASGD